MEAAHAQLEETLARLQADPELGAMMPFPALGWKVVMESAGETDKYRVRIFDMHGEMRVDQTLDAATIKIRLVDTDALDKRRGALMGALLAAEAEKFLAAL